MLDDNTPANSHEGINPAPSADLVEESDEAKLELVHNEDAPAVTPEAIKALEAAAAIDPLAAPIETAPVNAPLELVAQLEAAVEIEPPAGIEAIEEVAEIDPAASTDEAAPVSPDPTAVIDPFQSQQVTGIEILISMAAKGEIDPKNIDIIDVTDRFLKAISAVPKENLRQSGKIIFQASVLLRMKAEALLAQKVEEEMNFGDDYMDFDADGSPIIYDSNLEAIARQITLADLERALVRQTKVRQMRHRRVTLEQLIEALRDAERLESSRAERKAKPRIFTDGYNEMRDMDDILDLAHDEDIEDVISRIDQLLADLLNSDQVLSLLRIVEALGGRGDWVDAFLAVLFLSNAGKIQLEQEQFYGALFVTRGDAQSIVIPVAAPDAGPPLSH